jgi:hypothetical protein
MASVISVEEALQALDQSIENPAAFNGAVDALDCEEPATRRYRARCGITRA